MSFQAEADLTVIVLRLGHENPATTYFYVASDLAMKELALSAVQAPQLKQLRFQPTDRILQFLASL